MHVLLIVLFAFVALLPGSQPDIATIETPPLGVTGASVGVPAGPPTSRPLQLPLASHAPAAAEAHALIVEYTLPVTPTNLIVTNSGVWFTSFYQQTLGALDPATGLTRLYDFTGRGRLFDVEQDGTGRVWYSTTNSAFGNDSVGVFDPLTGGVTQWTLPRNHYGLSIASPSNDVWFVSKGLDYGQLSRLQPQTNTITTWSTNPYTDTYDLVQTPGGALWFTVQPRGQQGVGRLDPLTGQVTLWTLPAATSRPFRIAALHDDEIWLTEFDSTGNNISRLIPAQDRLEQYHVPLQAAAPAALVKVGNAIWFAAFEGNSIGRLDLAQVAPIVSQLSKAVFTAPTATQTVGPTTFTPTLTKTLAATTSTPTAGSQLGAFTVFALPQPNSRPFDIETGAADARLWFAEENAPRVGVITVLSPMFLPMLLR